MATESDSSKSCFPPGYWLDDLHVLDEERPAPVPLPPSPWAPNPFQPIRQLLLETTWELLLIERKKSGW